ncbi:MAG TPA: shikimate dehydrogenase [Oligoflexia bacterium]|nr:shikimate dehydrogenase [Oligoflexia bacterium]HMP27381.1 shikimate dehydrogenase [Oligoflexia bacterium]
MIKQKSHHQTITCLIGDPVEHSVSDVMFCRFAELTGIKNYSHLKFRVAKTNPTNLGNALRAIPILGISGANITLPYKELAMQYFDSIDRTAQFVGAINTLVNRNGKLVGYNSDCIGAVAAIKKKLRAIKSSNKIVIFGAGGASRAIIGGLPKVSQIVLLIRPTDSKRVEKLKKHFKKYHQKIEDKLLTDQNIISAIKDADFVINATPVGMYPNINNSLITKNHLEKIGKSKVKTIAFFDVVFNPFETEFLKLAKQYGAQTCPGIYMMIYQGIQAFKLWTGRRVKDENVEAIVNLLKKAIKFRYEK